MEACSLDAPTPLPFLLKGEVEFVGNLDAWVGEADPSIQISDFLPPSLPDFWGEKGGRGDERGNLSVPEPFMVDGGWMAATLWGVEV